jgi:hypothetical protein
MSYRNDPGTGAVLAIMAASAIVVLAIIYGAVSAYHGYWWLAQNNANHENQVIQNGSSYQESLRSEITKKIGDVEQMTVQIENPAYRAEKQAIISSRSYAAQIVCGDAGQITGVRLRPQQNAWVLKNCQDGTLKVTSIYNITGTAGA